MNREDTYLKDSIKKCVDYVMSKDDDDKRRIIIGMFQYNDYLLNEQLVVQALNDDEKQEWFTNDMFDSYTKEIDRLKEIISEALCLIEDARFDNLYAIDDILNPILNKLRESGIRNYVKIYKGEDNE